MNIENKFEALSNVIGSTPLLEISLLYRGEERKVYAKAEYYNMTGSIKDRMALYILKNAYAKGTIKEGDTIAEATSGNTGIAFSAIGRFLGNPVVIYMPDWMSIERKSLIKSYGAEIRLVSREEGGFLGSIKKAREFKESFPNVFLPNQFSNEDNVKAHFEGTGKEIGEQLEKLGKKADAVVAGVGTGGTLCGIGAYLKMSCPGLGIYPLEPASSPTISTGYQVGEHRIQGISDEFIPDILKRTKYDQVIEVDDGDAIIMAQKLSGELGLGVGISSGANLLGALKVQDIIGRDKTVVTVFSDDCKKYLSTDYGKEEPAKEGFLTNDIKLLSFKAVR